MGFLGRNFVLCSDIGSVWSAKLGLQTYEAKSDVTALGHNSRLRGDSTFLNSYSKSHKNLGHTGYLVDLSDFRAPRYGSVLNLRSESRAKPIGLCSFFAPFQAENPNPSRNTAHESPKGSDKYCRSQILRRFRI